MPFETTEGNLLFMRDAFLLRPYYSPHFKSYPEDAKEKGERGLYFWAIARESYIGFAYNTKLLAKEAVPKNYEGLLHPALKARMGVSVSDPAYKVIGAMLRTKGREFVQKLRVQEIALHTIIPPALLDLIASGEGARFAGDLSQSYLERHRQRRARQLGADGYRSNKRRRRCDCGATSPSACRLAPCRLSFRTRRSIDLGKVRVRQRD
jgi:hypothetical protein